MFAIDEGMVPRLRAAGVPRDALSSYQLCADVIATIERGIARMGAALGGDQARIHGCSRRRFTGNRALYYLRVYDWPAEVFG